MQVQKDLLYSHSKNTPTPTPPEDAELSLKQVDFMNLSAKETPAGDNFKTNTQSNKIKPHVEWIDQNNIQYSDSGNAKYKSLSTEIALFRFKLF